MNLKLITKQLLIHRLYFSEALVTIQSFSHMLSLLLGSLSIVDLNVMQSTRKAARKHMKTLYTIIIAPLIKVCERKMYKGEAVVLRTTQTSYRLSLVLKCMVPKTTAYKRWNCHANQTCKLLSTHPSKPFPLRFSGSESVCSGYAYSLLIIAATTLGLLATKAAHSALRMYT